jgi:hypothetical protein
VLSGNIDVDGMSPEEFDELMEMDEIEPFGISGLAWVMALVGAKICDRLAETSINGGEFKTINPKQFIPWHRKRKASSKPKREESGYMNPNQAAAIFQLMAGRGGA